MMEAGRTGQTWAANPNTAVVGSPATLAGNDKQSWVVARSPKTGTGGPSPRR